jgi:hypothetical protein
MFFFIHPWSGQSGSGFVPHSAAPPPSFVAVAAVLLASAVPVAAAVAEAAGSADADADGCALAVDGVAGALDATGGAVAVVFSEPGVGGDDSDLVHAIRSAAIETASESERMGGELTRNPG